MVTTVKITETYDLKTTVNKLGIIAIHTPTPAMIRQLYPGLCKNHRFFKLNRCDVTGVCASVLPADPLQVGVSSGDVAPEDMFNPILYKPVSNESFDKLIARMYAGAENVIGTQSLTNIPDAVDNPWDVYYAQLAEAKRWKKAMPQNGFGLRGLVPIVHTVLNSYGNTGPIGNIDVLDTSEDATEVPNLSYISGVANSLESSYEIARAVTFRGKAVKMPRLPLHTGMESASENGQTFSIPNFQIPKTYCAMFLIPPARLHEFYYRMRVSWTITFSGVISTLECDTMWNDQMVKDFTYYKNFSYPSKSLEKSDTLVDTTDVELTKIMES